MSPKLIPAALLALLLTGCASLNNVSSEVATYGAWPADRKPAGFTFDRLPSQDPATAHQTQLETSARGALEAAGFRAANDPAQAEFLVQVGARVVSTDPWIYNGSLFWRGSGFGPYGGGYGPYRRFGGGFGPGWGAGWGPGWGWGGRPYDTSSYEHEVVLVIRDRRSGTVLYEARADNAGYSPDIDHLLPALFGAAMQSFPKVDPKPRTVQIPLARG